jgi:hypothetical protein
MPGIRVSDEMMVSKTSELIGEYWLECNHVHAGERAYCHEAFALDAKQG